MKKFDHHSGTHFDVDGAKIYYEEAGVKNAPVLLFLHGGFGNIEDFNNIIGEVAGEYKIIGIDSRGHGKSTLGSSAPLTYERIQKDVERVLEHLGVESISIIGFSDGGIVAYRLAALTSLKIEKLVTIGASWHAKNIEPNRELFAKVTGESWRKKFPETYGIYQKINPEPDFDRLAQASVKM